MDPSAESVHRNKANVESNAVEESGRQKKPPGRFRRMIGKHRKSIANEAARTKPPVRPPPTDGVILILDSKTLELTNPDDPAKHQHCHGENHKKKTLIGRIRSGWKFVYETFGVRHIAFIAVMGAYAFAGGAIFSYLEREKLEKRNEQKIINLAVDRQDLVQRILYITQRPGRPASNLNDLLESYQRNNSMFPSEKLHWDIWDGVFYSFTVFTTIGYGHFVPVTHRGRIATMIYALFGIPLVLAVLADFGKLLTRILKRAYSIVRHTIVQVWELRKFKRMKAKGIDIFISQGEAEDIAQFDFPIPLALLMLVVYLFACASVFQIWEKNWDYFDAFYFFFISLSTIGLGDLVPDHPKYMIAGFPVILIGLTLVSLVINLIQNKIDQWREKAQELLEDQLGMETESASECDVEAGAGDAQKIEPHPRPKPDENALQKMDRVALGVLQTVKLRKKRRRIGTQTDESFVRDVLHGMEGESSPTFQHLNAKSQIHASATPKWKRPGDLASVDSGSIVFYDALSFSDLY